MELPVTNYTGIYPQKRNTEIFWQASKVYKGVRKIKLCKSERKAAIAYDKMCLDFGLEPVNILKRI